MQTPNGPLIGGVGFEIFGSSRELNGCNQTDVGCGPMWDPLTSLHIRFLRPNLDVLSPSLPLHPYRAKNIGAAPPSSSLFSFHTCICICLYILYNNGKSFKYIYLIYINEFEASNHNPRWFHYIFWILI